MNEWIIGLPILGIVWLLIENLNPKYCIRCERETFFPMNRHLQGNTKLPVFQYCLKCFFYINLSTYKCSQCKNTGNHRIHELGFLHRFLVIKRRKNIYKTCQCGNIVELVQK